MSTRFGSIAGLLLATLLAAGFASMSALSTQSVAAAHPTTKENGEA